MSNRAADGGERQPERDDVERAHGRDDEAPLEDEEPQAFTPTTPFGDAKPWAGSALDPEREEPEPQS